MIQRYRIEFKIIPSGPFTALRAAFSGGWMRDMEINAPSTAHAEAAIIDAINKLSV